MRIITWNVNGIRATSNKGELTRLIETHDPDILFMQEIKAGHDKIPEELKNPQGYRTHYNPAEKPGYAGTGVWIHERVYEDFDVRFLDSFPSDPTANEGRVAHIELKVKYKGEKVSELPLAKGGRGDLASEQNPPNPLYQWGIKPINILDIFGIYFPNGGKSEDAWKGKIVFYSEFAKYMDALRAEGHSVLWGGDINCAHHEIDLARPKENDGKIGFHPVERAWLDGRVKDGWHDIWREQNPDTPEVYSWWDPVTRSRERNVGWRIDALWCEDSLFPQVKSIGYLPLQMGSDHCPMYVDII